MPTPIDHTTAERLREMLGELQISLIATKDISEDAKWKLIESISNLGFRLVDELEGVVR